MGRVQLRSMLLACLVVFLASPALAGSGSLRLDFQAPAELDGDMRSVLPAGSHVAAYAIPGSQPLALSGNVTALDLDVVEVVTEHYEVGDITIADPGVVPDHHVRSENWTSAWLEVRPAQANATAIVETKQPMALDVRRVTVRSPATGLWLSSGPIAPATNTLEPFDANSAYWPNVLSIRAPGTTHHLSPEELHGQASGRFSVYFFGVTLRIIDDAGVHPIETGLFVERAPDDPSGLTDERVRVRRVAVVATLEGDLNMTFGGGLTHLLASAPDFSDVTALSAPLADLSGDVDGSQIGYGNQTHLDIQGSFNASFAPPDSGTTRLAASLEGDFAHIQENRAHMRIFDIGPQATAGFLASLLLLVWGFVSWLRRGTTWLWGQHVLFRLLTFAPLAARRDPAKVLDHPVRRDIYDLLEREMPFARLSEIRRAASAAFDISTLAVYEHLRILAAAGIVEIFRPRDVRTVFVGPNHGFASDPKRKAAVVLTESPMGMLVAQAIVASPGASQTDIVRRVNQYLRQVPVGGQRKISAAAVRKWIRKLERLDAERDAALGSSSRRRRGQSTTVSLVEARRDGKFTKYWPDAALVDVVKARCARGSGEVVHALRKKPTVR